MGVSGTTITRMKVEGTGATDKMSYARQQEADFWGDTKLDVNEREYTRTRKFPTIKMSLSPKPFYAGAWPRHGARFSVYTEPAEMKQNFWPRHHSRANRKALAKDTLGRQPLINHQITGSPPRVKTGQRAERCRHVSLLPTEKRPS